MKTIIIICILLCSGCITNKGHYDNYIKNYNGDGKITKSNCYSLVLFGYEYINFDLPLFNLNNKCNQNYKIGTLPKLEKIYVSLEIPDSSYNDELLNGSLEINIFKNGTKYLGVKSLLSKFNHSQKYGKYHEFTYMHYNENIKLYDTISCIQNESENTIWEINLSYENETLINSKSIAWINLGCGECNAM
jgi:hypothetical protein